MKQFAWSKIMFIPKLLLWFGVAVSLSFSGFTLAATAGSAQANKDFNHMSTGYPLTGLHTTVDCGTCHVGGVFKGTPKVCSGCHTKGQRVVATAMSTKHIVTSESCETCHVQTVTFYGAKFNHGKAVPGQCATCHNGVTTTGRPASHTTVTKATNSCDKCHRTYAWNPASWNHYSDRSPCVTCHINGQNAFFKTPVTGTSPEGFAHRSAYNCESCHTSYFSWGGAAYDHAGAGVGPICATCHNGSTATGTMQKAGHVVLAAGDNCDDCHFSTRSWLPALGAMPSTHTLFNIQSPCKTCHSGGSHLTGNALHAYVPTTCNTCHWTGAANAAFSVIRKSNHKGNTNCGNGGCHSSKTSWNR